MLQSRSSTNNDERTLLVRFKLEKYAQILSDEESQLMAHLPAGEEEPAVTIRKLSHTLYALLATLTTEQSLRLVHRVENRNGFEAWRQLVAENTPKTAGRRFAMLQTVLQPGMGDDPAKFEEMVKSWNTRWMSTKTFQWQS